MKSAPFLKFVRTCLVISSGPSARLCTEGTCTYGENCSASPAPPVDDTYAPATSMRGPGTTPASIALRSATST